MIRRMLDAATAAKRIAAAEESAAVNLRLYAQQCARTKAAEGLAVELNEEARGRLAEVRMLREERDNLAEALEKSRQIAAGRAVDLEEARRDVARLSQHPGFDPLMPPAAAGEAAGLKRELELLRHFAVAQENRLALAEGRDIQGTVVGHGRTG